MASQPHPKNSRARTRARRPAPDRLPVASSAAVTVTLDNGLGIILREDHSAPVVAVQAWCRTGSLFEGRWLGAGLSHVLEHMLFKGTQRRTGPRLDQEVTEAGGYFNAYTSFDRTVYWINVPSSGTQVAVDVLCDIMQHALLPPDELARELDVIRREMDMNHDDPGQRSSRRLFEVAFTHHPCRYPIIGRRDLFDQLQPEDIRAYYDERYVPNNTFFVIAGDICVPEVVEQIRKAYQGRSARPLPPIYIPAEPRQTSSRLVVEEAAVALGHVHYSWHIPDVRHPDIPALDVLATLLGGGRSSRLYQQVRDQQGLVHSIDAWTYNPAQAGVFGISAIIDGHQHDAASQSIFHQLALICTRPVSVAELNKAKKQFLAATLSSRKTMQGQAQDLGGSWLVADDLGFSERYLAAVTSLTPPDLLRVVLKEDHRLPFVEFKLVFLGGVLRESPACNGLTSLLTRTLLKGTRRKSAQRIAREIESVGGHLDAYGGNNSFGVQLEVLRPDFDLGLGLLTEVILEANFPKPEVERERSIQLAGIRSQQDQMLKSTALLMRQNLFGPQGYGLDTLGTEQSVSQLSIADLLRAQRDWIQPRNAVLVVAGDLDPAAAMRKLIKAFSKWPAGPATPPPANPSPFPDSPGFRRFVETRDKRQAVVVLGYPGTVLSHPDRFALELLQEACSDLGSRLFLRVRDQLGLAYYVGAQHFAGLSPGYFAFYAGTAPSRVERVEQELLAEAAQLAADGLTAEELQRAKAKILGQKKIARQDLGNLALTMALDELYGLGYQRSDLEDAAFESVTLEQVRDSARRYLQPHLAVSAILSGTSDDTQADAT